MNRTLRRRPFLVLVPLVVALTGMAGLPVMRTLAQTGPNPNTSNCEPNLQSSVDPESLVLGETAQVQLTMNMSCPDYKLPVDIVFVVDTSNSMTRGANVIGVDPTGEAGGVISLTPPAKVTPPPPDPGPVPPAPLQVDPPPAKTADPSAPPSVPLPGAAPGSRNSDPPGCEQTGGGAIDPGGGGGGLPTLPTVGAPTPRVTPDPRATVPPVGPGDPAATRTAISSRPTASTGVDASRQGEPAGTEDLIRQAKEFVRDFIDQPQIQQDLANGTLRVGLVSFADRGRRLVSLNGEGKRVTGRLSLLRGGGKTRVDLGLRTAEAVLLERNNARRVFNDADHTKVMIVISDGGFCARDMRVRVDKRIEVITLAAGRGPYATRLRQMSSEPEYALKLNAKAVKETMFLYDKDFLRTRPVTVPSLEMSADLEPTMQLVDGSANPPATIDGQRLTWKSPDIDWTGPVTLTYGIRPLSGGVLNVNALAQVTWQDSEKRPGLGVFPAIFVDVAGPTATATPEIKATATPELR